MSSENSSESCGFHQSSWFCIPEAVSITEANAGAWHSSTRKFQDDLPVRHPFKWHRVCDKQLCLHYPLLKAYTAYWLLQEEWIRALSFYIAYYFPLQKTIVKFHEKLSYIQSVAGGLDFQQQQSLLAGRVEFLLGFGWLIVKKYIVPQKSPLLFIFGKNWLPCQDQLSEDGLWL